MANAITDYVKDFNQNGSSGCVTGSWQSLGPHNKPSGTDGGRGMGQIHALKFSPDYATDSIVYAGSNWGGLWRRIGNGNWEVLGTDTQLAFTSVTDIVIDPNNLNTIYITTGEADRTMGHYAQNPNGTPSQFTPLFTAGVYRTTDGGNTWESINGTNETLLDFFSDGGTIRRILMHPDSSQILYIASSLGIFKTNDATIVNPVWSQLSNAPNDFEYKGFEFKPGNPQTLYASGKDIYRSTNGGNTWNSITGAGTGLDLNNLPDTFRVQRINIAVTPADTNLIYAYIVGIDYNTPTTADVPKLFLYMYNGSNWTSLYSLETSRVVQKDV